MSEPLEDIRLDYQEVNQNIRWLGEIRFKLLAFIPAISGVAVALLSGGRRPEAPATIGISVFGLVVTVGVVVYDLRNSQVYNALLYRARYLEGELGHRGSGLRSGSIGQYGERPLPWGEGSRFAITHGLGLTLIYASAVGLWVSSIVSSSLLAAEAGSSAAWGGIAGALAGVLTLVALSWVNPTKSPAPQERDTDGIRAPGS